jgi:hypothetical protein
MLQQHSSHMWICMAVLEDGAYCEHCNDGDEEVCAACGRVRPAPAGSWSFKRLLRWFNDFLLWDRASR